MLFIRLPLRVRVRESLQQNGPWSMLRFGALFRGTISWVLLPLLPQGLWPGQSDSRAEIATWAIQQASQTSWDIVLILLLAEPVE